MVFKYQYFYDTDIDIDTYNHLHQFPSVAPVFAKLNAGGGETQLLDKVYNDDFDKNKK